MDRPILAGVLVWRCSDLDFDDLARDLASLWISPQGGTSAGVLQARTGVWKPAFRFFGTGHSSKNNVRLYDLGRGPSRRLPADPAVSGISLLASLGEGLSATSAHWFSVFNRISYSFLEAIVFAHRA